MRKQQHGFLLVDKPEGVTSRRVLDDARRIFGKKGGVEGILDPFATGLLILAFGDATRYVSYLHQLTKTYTGIIELGKETDTLDTEGQVIKESDVGEISEEQLREAEKIFSGEIKQVPPVYSNARVGGRRARELVREGESVELSARQVTIHRLVLKKVSPFEITFEAEVSAGTYIRSLARDIAHSWGLPGYLKTLRRTQTGSLRVESCVRAGEWDENSFEPIENVLSFLPKVYVSDNEASLLKHGREIQSSLPEDIPHGLAIEKESEQFLGIITVQSGKVRPVRLRPTK